jgi:hypothetical protein
VLSSAAFCGAYAVLSIDTGPVFVGLADLSLPVGMHVWHNLASKMTASANNTDTHTAIKDTLSAKALFEPSPTICVHLRLQFEPVFIKHKMQFKNRDLQGSALGTTISSAELRWER